VGDRDAEFLLHATFAASQIIGTDFAALHFSIIVSKDDILKIPTNQKGDLNGRNCD
jgi:hypothetical protein